MKQKFFDLARKISSKSDHHRYKIGCVIVRKNNIVGIGFNQLKTHPKSPHKFSTIHAEFSALLGADPADLIGSEIYVYRQTRNGLPAIAKPCPSCTKMLQNIGIKKVYYTINEGYDGYENN